MNKKLVVCSKYHMINFYDNYIWLCPICNKNFSTTNNNFNEDITKKLLENRINNQCRQNISLKNNILEISCEKNKNNLTNDQIIKTPEKLNKIEYRKQIFSCSKRISAGNKLELSNYKCIDNTQIIHTNNKSSENIFITLQESQKKINQIFNYKNEQNNPISNSKNDKFIKHSILTQLSSVKKHTNIKYPNDKT